MAEKSGICINDDNNKLKKKDINIKKVGKEKIS